jgi:hypothetical protein
VVLTAVLLVVLGLRGKKPLQVGLLQRPVVLLSYQGQTAALQCTVLGK